MVVVSWDPNIPRSILVEKEISPLKLDSLKEGTLKRR